MSWNLPLLGPPPARGPVVPELMNLEPALHTFKEGFFLFIFFSIRVYHMLLAVVPRAVR